MTELDVGFVKNDYSNGQPVAIYKATVNTIYYATVECSYFTGIMNFTNINSKDTPIYYKSELIELKNAIKYLIAQKIAMRILESHPKPESDWTKIKVATPEEIERFRRFNKYK